LWSPVANAEEYHLQVANLYRTSFAHFIDGPIRTGSGELAMPGLERSLDSGEMQPGALLTDRPLRYGWDELVNGVAAVKVRASVSPGEGPRRWDEAVWEGKPGEKSVWVIASSAPSHQEVYLVVEHPPKPTTFKAVIGWERRRSSDRYNFEGVGVIR
jgi:hypothetical protein